MSLGNAYRIQVCITWGRNWRRESKDKNATKTLGIKVIVGMEFTGSKALWCEKYKYVLKQLQESPSYSKLCRIMFFTILLGRQLNGISRNSYLI